MKDGARPFSTPWTRLHPVAVLLLVVASSVALEFTVILLLISLRVLPESSPLTALLGASLLGLMITPVLWWWIVHPLRSTAERAREQYRALFRGAPDGLVTIDREGRILSFNPAAESMFGWQAEEVLGGPATRLMPPGEAARHEAAFRRLVESAGPMEPVVSFRVTALRKDGSPFPVELSVWESSPGGVPGFTGILRDVSRQEAARDRMRLLSSAVDSAANAIVITDREGTIAFVNPAFTRLTGYEAAEVLGRTPRVLKSGSHDAAFYRGMWETILRGEVWHGELTNRRKDGTPYTEEQTITPVRNGDGEVTHFIAVKLDVTEERKQAAQERQSQRMETVGRLAGGVAHDFNNLLTVILGYGEMAMGRLLPGDPARDNVDQVVKAGKRSAALTRQLLAFSRKQALQPQVLDLNSVLRNLEKMLGRLLAENIRLELVPAPDLAPVRADPGQVEQVVMNLCVNARDAMPGGGTLTIETANVSLDASHGRRHPGVAPGRYAMIAVTDTGTGMDPETQAHIFEPFFTTKEEGKGTGLGLATVHGIVNQSGGHVEVISEPGRGSCFKVHLPCTEARDGAASDSPAAESPRGGGRRILVVEDEPAVRGLVKGILEERGFRVTVAARAEEALLLVDGGGLRPDLVITDVVMPGMAGPELVDRLRARQSGLRAVYMSGYTDSAVARQATLVGMAPFLQKPFSAVDLEASIERALSEVPVVGAGAAGGSTPTA